jgi:hypothetical protein
MEKTVPAKARASQSVRPLSLSNSGLRAVRLLCEEAFRRSRRYGYAPRGPGRTRRSYRRRFWRSGDGFCDPFDLIAQNRDLELKHGHEPRSEFGAAIQLRAPLFWPQPLTSVTVRPCTPTRVSASRISSNLNGPTIAVTNFMDWCITHPLQVVPALIGPIGHRPNSDSRHLCALNGIGIRGGARCDFRKGDIVRFITAASRSISAKPDASCLSHEGF